MKPKPCEWNGQLFKSIAEAAKHVGIKATSMGWRLKHGYTCDEDLRHAYGRKPCEWNGRHYPSQTAAAKANCIAPETMWHRLKRGYTCDADMEW